MSPSVSVIVAALWHLKLTVCTQECIQISNMAMRVKEIYGLQKLKKTVLKEPEFILSQKQRDF